MGTGRAPLSQTREGPPSVALSQVGVRLGRQFSPHPAPKGKSQRGQSPVALQGRGPQDSWAPGPCAPRGPGPAPRMATVPVVGHGPAMLVAQARPVCPHRGEMVSALGTPEPGHSHILLPSPSPSLRPARRGLSQQQRPLRATPTPGPEREAPPRCLTPRGGGQRARREGTHVLRPPGPPGTGAAGAAGGPRGLLPPGPCLGAPLLAVKEEGGHLPWLAVRGVGGAAATCLGLRTARSSARPPQAKSLAAPPRPGDTLHTAGPPLTSP